MFVIWISLFKAPKAPKVLQFAEQRELTFKNMDADLMKARKRVWHPNLVDDSSDRSSKRAHLWDQATAAEFAPAGE